MRRVWHVILRARLLSAGLLLIANMLIITGGPVPQAAAANTCDDVYAPLPTWITDDINQPTQFQDGNFTNISAYQSVSNSTGVPWEMLAAIHYRETSFSHSNPSNLQGIFQFVNGDGGPYPPGLVTYSNFVQQLTYMAQRIQSDYVYRDPLTFSTLPPSQRTYVARPLKQNEPDDFRVQDTLFSYNGRASAYAQNAALYGFSSTTAPYEGSPYVMNMFDCARANMGLITQDGGGIDSIDTRYGAFTLYVRLKSDSYWQSRYDFLGRNTTLNLPGCPQATDTTLECVWKLKQLGTGTPAIAATNAQRDLMITYGYTLAGTEFFANVAQAPQPGNIPVYEVLGAPGTAPFYTSDANERDTLVQTAGYTDGGIAFYVDPVGSNSGYPVYRVYNPNTGVHMWVGSQSEVQTLRSQGYTREGVAVFNSIDSVRQTAPAPAGQANVYRFSNMPGNTHFWTTDLTERDAMIQAGYHYEGVAWYSSASVTSAPVYRLYSSQLQQHLFTADPNEKNVLSATSTWHYEGIAFYQSATPTARPVYRLYSPINFEHFFTTDANERDTLVRVGTFRSEGTAWYQP